MYRYVNSYQSKEERKKKYKISKLLGYDTKTAAIFRDYHVPYLIRLLKYGDIDNDNSALIDTFEKKIYKIREQYDNGE